LRKGDLHPIIAENPPQPLEHFAAYIADAVFGVVNPDLDSSSLSDDLNGIQVLIVDDDADSRDFIAFVVEQAGASVITSATAAEAIATLMQSHLDVLLSDIGMPDMDGYMLMRQVRLLPPEQGGQVKAIALTAYAGDFNQQQALQAGFQQHLSKPVEPEMLVKAIVNLLKVGKIPDFSKKPGIS